MPRRSLAFCSAPTANQVCKWMFYIIILFKWGWRRVKQSNWRCMSGDEIDALCCLYSKRGLRLAWKGGNAHVAMWLVQERTHPTPPSLLRRPSLRCLHVCARGLRGVAARCGCKWTAVTQFYSCLSCCHDTLAVAVVTGTLRSIRFTFGKFCHVELGFKSRFLLSSPCLSGSRFD